MENTKQEYQAPQLKVVSMKVEQGFAGSLFGSLSLWTSAWGSTQIEDYSTRSGWDDNSSNTFWD